MCKKLIYLACFCLVVALVLTSTAQADLVGWWRLDDGSGTTASDSSGVGNDGTLVGSPQWVASGKVNGALEFDGGDSVSVDGAADIQPESLTLMTWVNFNEVDSSLGRQDYLSKDDDYALSLHEGSSDQKIHGIVTSAGDWQVVHGDTVVEVGNWYHTALTYDAGTDMLTLYLDGEFDAELSVTAGLEHRRGGILTLGTFSGRDLRGAGRAPDGRDGGPRGLATERDGAAGGAYRCRGDSQPCDIVVSKEAEGVPARRRRCGCGGNFSASVKTCRRRGLGPHRRQHPETAR